MRNIMPKLRSCRLNGVATIERKYRQIDRRAHRQTDSQTYLLTYLRWKKTSKLKYKKNKDKRNKQNAWVHEDYSWWIDNATNYVLSSPLIPSRTLPNSTTSIDVTPGIMGYLESLVNSLEWTLATLRLPDEFKQWMGTWWSHRQLY